MSDMAIYIVLSVYFLPTIVCAIRRHHNTLAIFVLNIFLGWTFVGWVVAMVWSCTADTKLKPRLP